MDVLFLTIFPICSNQLFSFDDYPQVAERIERIIRQLSFDLLLLISNASKVQWLFPNKKNDALVGSVLQKLALSATALTRYMAPNLSALEAFQQRTVGGRTLADRVRQYAAQFRKEIELGIDIGYGDEVGRSAEPVDPG